MVRRRLCSKCSWVIQVSHFVDCSLSVILLSFIYNQQRVVSCKLEWQCPDKTLIWSLLPSGAGERRKRTARQYQDQKKKRLNESETYSRWCFGRSKIQKPEYTVHTVATIIVQTAKYSWSVKMYRPYLHSADCPIGKQLNFFFKVNINSLHHQFGSVHAFADRENHRKPSLLVSNTFLHERCCLQQSSSWNIFNPFKWNVRFE